MAKNIYIQTILFNNLCDDLRRSLLSLRQSIIFYKNKYNGSDSLYKFWVKYGDASEKKIFDDEQVLNIKKEFGAWFEFEYYFFDENTGTSKGHNILAKNILLESFECLNSDYLLIMNPDVVLEYDFFIEILEPFKRLEKVGIVEARQTPLEHPKDYDIKTGETSWAAFACAIIKAKLFKKLNGFDENLFFMYCDDVDFSWRARLNENIIIYNPRAIAFHPKYLDAFANIKTTEAEKYYSAEAALFLAYKYSNSRLLKKLLSRYKKSKDKNLKLAEHNFSLKKKNGDLPEQIDKNHKIATFINDACYSKIRF